MYVHLQDDYKCRNYLYTYMYMYIYKVITCITCLYMSIRCTCRRQGRRGKELREGRKERERRRGEKEGRSEEEGEEWGGGGR